MAFNLGNKKGPISDINVTPLVDVMLVLLVIFMVSAPLMFSGVKLDLPKTKKVNSLRLTKKQAVLSFMQDGSLLLGEKKFLPAEIVAEVEAAFKDYKTDTLFLRADYQLEYGKVAKLMAMLKRGGISKIALVTEIEKER